MTPSERSERWLSLLDKRFVGAAIDREFSDFVERCWADLPGEIEKWANLTDSAQKPVYNRYAGSFRIYGALVEWNDTPCPSDGRCGWWSMTHE